MAAAETWPLFRRSSSIKKTFLMASHLQAASVRLQFTVVISTSKQIKAPLHICCRVLCLPVMLFWRDCKIIIFKNLIWVFLQKHLFIFPLMYCFEEKNLWTFFFLIWVTISWDFLSVFQSNFFGKQNLLKIMCNRVSEPFDVVYGS